MVIWKGNFHMLIDTFHIVYEQGNLVEISLKGTSSFRNSTALANVNRIHFECIN